MEDIDVGTFPAIAALVIFGLAIVLTIFLVFKAVVIRIPVAGRQPFMLAVKYYIAPVAAVLAMLACTSMSIADVGRGLLGNDQIQPYGILILFMSMAYIAGSLDATGIFAWLALKFTTMSGGRGRVLFLFYFLLSSFITTFTSNDVCILTLTPIVCYFAKATGVDPLPFLFAEYAAANTFGALLYTGNPTNIIVADAYNMTFLGYSKYMTLPTFAAGAACFAMLLLEFHRRIPARIPLPTVDASHMLRDKLGAAAGSVNMLTCLGLLAAAPSLGWSMWAITLVCAGIHCAYNLWAFQRSLLHVPLGECWTCGCGQVEEERAQQQVGLEGGGAAWKGDGGGGAAEKEGGGGCGRGGAMVSECATPPPSGKGFAVSAVAAGLEAEKASVRQQAGPPAVCRGDVVDSAMAVQPPAQASKDSGSASSCRSGGAPSEFGSGGSGGSGRSHAGAGRGCCGANLTPAACARAPAGPLAESLVQGSPPNKLKLPLTSLALAAETEPPAAAPPPEVAPPPVMTVDSLRGKAPTFWGLLFDLPWEVVPFALGMFVLVEGLYVQGWLNVFGNGMGRASTALPAAVFIIGFLSVALANTINNQPMTILLTRVALDRRYTAHVGYGNTHKAALFSLVLGSNIGAVFTLIGALAGILWSNIMGLHGLKVSYGHFARVCCPVGFVTLVASLLVLWFEFTVFPHTD